jgi:sodium transport system permease protein
VLRTALIVARKEVREAIRDKQTLIYTLAVPLALYPVLIWLGLQVFLIVQAQDARTAVSVALVGSPQGISEARLDAAIGTEDDVLEPGLDGEETARTREVLVERLEPGLTIAGLAELLIDPESGRAPEEAPDAIVFFKPEGGAEILHVSTRGDSRLAAERVEASLTLFGSNLRSEALLETGRNPNTIAPFIIETRDLSKKVDRGGMILSLVLPLMFVVMSVLGAFFPAVDLTSGEKERKTIETTLLVPVSRTGVQLGKVLAVTLAASVATSVNLVGMGLATKHLLASFGAGLPTIEIPWFAFLRAAPLGLVFLVAISSIMVALASFADTFKQGQALLNSVMMLFILPAVFAVMPGIELTPGLALVPVVQTVLGFKAMLAPSGLSGHGLAFALVIISQLVYAFLILRLSLYLTSREALSMRSAKPGQIKALLRSRATPR